MPSKAKGRHMTLTSCCASLWQKTKENMKGEKIDDLRYHDEKYRILGQESEPTWKRLSDNSHSPHQRRQQRLMQ